MSNIKSAQAAIEAELAHAKQGLEFYHSRIEALENMLAQLDSVSSGVALPDAKGLTGKRAGKLAAVKAGKKKTDVKGSRGGSGLPFTGGDYWQNLVIAEPRSASEILNAAIASLDFSPNKMQIQKLAGRMTFALNALVKTNKIQDSGSGRERRFFRA